MSIEYRTGDLLQYNPKFRVILHACNGRGIWGAGFAKQLAIYDRVAEAHHVLNRKRLSTGDCDVYLNRQYMLLNAVTSTDVSDRRDEIEVILLNTEDCLINALTYLDNLTDDIEIHMPKINSGLFGVPWEKTEAVILKWQKDFSVANPIIVWSL